MPSQQERVPRRQPPHQALTDIKMAVGDYQLGSQDSDSANLGKPTRARLSSTEFPGKAQLWKARESQVLP